MNMAAALKAPKSGLLELRVAVERWSRVLGALSEDALSVSPAEANEEPAKSKAPAAAPLNGEPSSLSCAAVPEHISSVKRTVRVTKQDVGGLGISIKGRRTVSKTAKNGQQSKNNLELFTSSQRQNSTGRKKTPVKFFQSSLLVNEHEL